MWLTHRTAPLAFGGNRCRPTSAPSTASAFFASIAASSLRHNALCGDPRRPHWCGRPAPRTATRPRSFSLPRGFKRQPFRCRSLYPHDRTLTNPARLRATWAAVYGTAIRSGGSSGRNVQHLGTAARRTASWPTTAVTRTSWPASTITARQPSAADQDRRTAGSPGPSATPARTPRAMQGCGAIFGATVGVAEVNPPFRYDFRYLAVANVVRGSRWRRCGWSPAGESALRLWGVERGWERPPSDPRIYGPETHGRASTSATARRSLPARACGASDPCGKASGPPAAGPGGGRRSLRRRRGPRRGRGGRATARGRR